MINERLMMYIREHVKGWAAVLHPSMVVLIFLGLALGSIWRSSEPSSRVLRWFVAGTAASTVFSLMLLGL
jgi:hypothetical protein